jgi:hypothetical protein
MPKVAIVQSVFDFAIREINALEGQIVASEDDANAKLWDQARTVVAQLEAGLSQRALAAQWINGRTGEPYSQSHVRNTVAVVSEYLTTQHRPRFREAYNAVSNAKTTVTKREPEPFHWINAVGDLVETVETMVHAWPEQVRPLAPKALRDLAESLEQELGGSRDVSRRDRTEGAGTDTNPVVGVGTAHAS